MAVHENYLLVNLQPWEQYKFTLHLRWHGEAAVGDSNTGRHTESCSDIVGSSHNSDSGGKLAAKQLMMSVC